MAWGAVSSEIVLSSTDQLQSPGILALCKSQSPAVLGAVAVNPALFSVLAVLGAVVVIS